MTRKVITNNLIILAFLVNFIITSLLFLSSPLLLLLLLLLQLFYDHYAITITYYWSIGLKAGPRSRGKTLVISRLLSTANITRPSGRTSGLF